MNFDLTTGILIGAAVLLGIAYFARRSSRQKRQNRKL
jgi:MFS superfamily sulfate permease-like transporter